MHRLTVALLAAFDAAIAAAAGIAATLAPLTLLWVFGLGDAAEWGALWPAGAKIWQFGHLVPMHITLPGEYIAVTGIDLSAASFAVSLAPLAFATFTAIFAARSGARASGADAWITGVVTGSVVFTALAALVALTSHTAIAEAPLWQALLFPALVFALPMLAGAVVTEWRDAGRGVIARLRDRTEALPGGWGPVPGITVRAASAAIVGLIGLGALAVAVAVLMGAGQIVALYQAGNFDLLGAIVVTLTQFAYLPTFVVWGLSFVAGPGFALGTGTAVSPAGTQLGVVPGVPVLGAVPESTTTWLLLLALLPIGVGALAGWIARSRFAATQRPPVSRPAPTAVAFPTAETAAFSADTGGLDEDRRAALAGLLTPGAYGATGRIAPTQATAESPTTPEAVRVSAPVEPFLPRLVLTVAIAVLAAGASALLAAVASGAAGPGRLVAVGPQPGPVALAVGLEVALGASILLLSSRRGERGRADEHAVESEGTPGPLSEVAPAATQLPEGAAEPLPEHAPTPELGAAAALARWAATRSAEARAVAASDEGAPAGAGASSDAPVRLVPEVPEPTTPAAPAPAAPAPAAPAPAAPAPTAPAPAAPAPTAPAPSAPAPAPSHTPPGIDPDADTAPIPLPRHFPHPDQAMRPHQEDPADSGL